MNICFIIIIILLYMCNTVLNIDIKRHYYFESHGKTETKAPGSVQFFYQCIKYYFIIIIDYVSMLLTY